MHFQSITLHKIAGSKSLTATEAVTVSSRHIYGTIKKSFCSLF
jgi:hypothetical protein